MYSLRLLLAATMACTCLPVASDATTREIGFGQEDRLVGQLDRPDEPGLFPLIVLVPAGKDIDRNGTSAKLPAIRNLYSPLADLAVAAGYAIFRYERTEPTGPRRIGRGNDVLQDALDAVEIALELPGADPDRVVLMAHESGVAMLLEAYDRFEEIVGYRHLRGVVLLAGEIGAHSAGRMAGDLLIVRADSDGYRRSSADDDAIGIHRRTSPVAGARQVIAEGCNSMLCDTVDAPWSGLMAQGAPCRFSGKLFRSVDAFLRRAAQERD